MWWTALVTEYCTYFVFIYIYMGIYINIYVDVINKKSQAGDDA
jgi:hypothetical protein